MSGIFKKILSVTAVCILTLGNSVIQIHSADDICITKTRYIEEDLTFSPDSKYLVASWDEENGIARLWDVETGKLIQTFSYILKGMEKYEHWGRFAFSSDSKYLLAGDINFPVVVLWDVQTGQKLYEVEPDGKPYRENTSIKLSVSPNDKYFLIWGDVSTRIHDFKTGTQLYRLLEPSFQPATFSKDSKYVLMPNDNYSDDERTFMLWDVSTGTKVSSIGKNAIYSGFVDGGRYIGTVTTYETTLEYTLWDASTYHEVSNIDLGDKITDVKFSPNGKYLAVENHYTSLTLWDAVAGQPLLTFDNSFGNGTAEFTQDSQYLLIGLVGFAEREDVPVAHLWDINRNKERADFLIDNKKIAAVAEISPDNKYLATGYDNGELHLWNIPTGEERHLEC